jgi:hypothetical protein
MKRIKFVKPIVALIMFSVVGCSDQPNFGYLPSSELHQQNQSVLATQLDILWVIDNSLSMEVSQNRLAANFDSFIDGFRKRTLDYQMGVITTEAWRDLFKDSSETRCFSCLRDGNAKDGPSGYPIVRPDTPNMKDVFLKNVLQGVDGTGDERAFQSIRTALDNPENAGFLRPGSYLAVIIVSDEDDFSHSGSAYLKEDYNDERLEPVSTILQYLDGKTRNNSPIPMFNISSITIPDFECRDKIIKNEGGNGQRLGPRHIEAAQRSSGLVGSLCDEFSKTLQQISGRLLELLTRFPLSRRPDPSTITVWVDGRQIPESVDHGWTYSEEDNSIWFHGEEVPHEGARIRIDFTPQEIKG